MVRLPQASLLTELPEIGAIARESGAVTIVDAVTTLGTMPFMMDEWQLDAVVSGGQKGLGAIPGISLVAFSSRSLAANR
jgi:alanine-glyoxylate transaminase / serine-glyoxylate transaminase / serine-pyruvate transaminase